MEGNYKIYSRGIILNKTGEVLLMKKRKNQKIGGGEWLLPGGTLEFGENIEQTLIREIKEETNLEVNEINLLTQKKMIIGDTHWLGIYFVCKVKDENQLSNLEREKHKTIGFFSLDEIPKMKDYMIVKMVSNFSQEYFDIKAVDWKEHSMQKYLHNYVDNKVHSLIKENISNINYIKIVGNFDRSNIISKEEKNDKKFNYKRPTAFLDEDTIYISCFPGEDYIKHYANIIATYFKINNLKSPLISYRLPNQTYIYNTFDNSGIKGIPDSDVIIFGNVDKIGLFEDKEFIETGEFYYKEGIINNKKILLLGCKFSIWGNIGEYLINYLSKKINFKTFIYIGKLGSLDINIVPNNFIATGNISYIGDTKIEWNNIFGNIDYDNMINGGHITCYSIIEETISYIHLNKRYGNFIDPEIGHMAKSCNLNGKNFSYLHIISDNVVIPHEENLSNERKKEILEKRKKLFFQIGDIIGESL